MTIWVDRVDQHWADLGIAKEIRIRLRHDLVDDLGQAILGGAAATELVTADPRHFVEDVVAAEGLMSIVAAPVTSHHDEVEGLAAHAVTGALAGGIVASITVLPVGFRVFNRLPLNSGDIAIATILAIYFCAALLAAAGGALAVWWAFRAWLHRRRLAIGSGLGLLACGLVATAVTTMFARSTGYSDAPTVVVVEMVLVLSTLLLGMVAVARALHVDRIFLQQ